VRNRYCEIDLYKKIGPFRDRKPPKARNRQRKQNSVARDAGDRSYRKAEDSRG
ncbi:hypothetical protein J6590_059234, partial [Homalodisca vitripennis]